MESVSTFTVSPTLPRTPQHTATTLEANDTEYVNTIYKLRVQVVIDMRQGTHSLVSSFLTYRIACYINCI